MAKKTKHRKKRIKRQLKRQFKKQGKQVTKQTQIDLSRYYPPFEEFETVTEPPEMRLYLGKYEAENAEYQARLDAVYAGTVSAIERHINPNATLLHYCSECKREFFARPLWLLSKEAQKHVCGLDSMKSKANKVKEGKKELTDKDKKDVLALFEQGMSKTKIANVLGVKRSLVIDHLCKAGVK